MKRHMKECLSLISEVELGAVEQIMRQEGGNQGGISGGTAAAGSSGDI